jgi:hypothetical protein
MKLRFLRLSVIIAIWLFPMIVLAASEAEKTLDNPLGTTDIPSIIGRVIKALLGLSGAAALLMFVWGGFLWLISRGEPAQVTKGKDTLKWATIGLVVIFSAYILVNAVINALSKGTALDAPG